MGSTRRRAYAAFAGVLVLASVAACASGGETTATPNPTPATAGAASSSAAASPQPTNTGPAIPQTLAFSSATVDGGHFDGASLAGKPAVLWFWAAWCPRCRAKADNVVTAHADANGKVTFVGVAGLGSGADAMAQFVSQNGLGGFTHLADDQGTVWRHFGVTEQEFFVLLDATGTIVHKGPLSDGDLRQRVAALAG